MLINKNKIRNLYHLVCNLFFRRNNLFILLIKSRLLKHNKIIIGKGCVIRDCEFILKSGNVIYVGDSCKLQGLRIFMNSSGNELFVGKGTIVNADKKQRTLFNVCGGSKIEIGENCLFSNSIELHTTDYHQITKDGEIANVAQPIIIGEHCWIGLQSLILKGVVLEKDVIVGSRSLVTKSFKESNIIIAGHPAVIKSKGVEWNH